MVEDNYISLRCLHPKRVFNKSLGRWIEVPCRTCLACRKARRNTWTTRLNSHAYNHKYQHFVTLTYSEEHVPRVFLGETTKQGDLERTFRIYKPDFSAETAPFFVKDASTLKWIDNFFAHVNKVSPYKSLSDYSRASLTCFSVEDIQKYHKRLRIHLQRLYKSKHPNCTNYEVRNNTYFTYFLVSEYGPTTLRSHYHALYFFNSDWLSAHFDEEVCKAWKLGRCTSESVRSSCSKYVAGYLSNYTSLPSFYTIKALRPIMLCSKSVPIGFSEISNDDFFKDVFLNRKKQIQLHVAEEPFTLDVNLSSFFINKLFPRLPYQTSLDISVVKYFAGVSQRYTSKEWLQYCQSVMDASFDKHSDCNLSIFFNSIHATCNTFKNIYSYSRRIQFLCKLCSFSVNQVLDNIEAFYTERIKDSRQSFYALYNKSIQDEQIFDDDFYCFFPVCYKSVLPPYSKPIEQCTVYSSQKSALQQVESDFHSKRCKQEYLELHPEKRVFNYQLNL